MKRCGNLFERVVDFDNLALAAEKAFRGHKSAIDVARFDFHLETEIFRLQEELITGAYQPRPLHSFEIFEPKRRLICAAHIRDRVAHHAICNVIEPILERGLIYDTYACREGKGTHAAIERAQQFARRASYFVKCDIRKYFASIDQTVLKSLLRRKIKDARLIDLLDRIIDQTVPESQVGKGMPIGNLTSQHFANFYLSELDHFSKERLRVKGYLRYMDDFLIFGDDKRGLRETISAVRSFLEDRLLLELKEETLVLAPVRVGLEFLGFRVFPNLLRVDRRKWTRFKRRVRELESAYLQGEISEEEMAQRVSSMVAHISHADTLAARKKVFELSLRLG
ncbi:MAG: reverse transcriptase domain-containing protein [Acidobacteriota bacterium]